jgi:hypothetical protein
MQNSNIKPGNIAIREGQRGKEFHCFNLQRKKMVHVGTLIGVTYEKITAILLRPEPSISLTRNEFNTAQDSGALFLRFISSDKSRTYCISTADFRQHASPYYQENYGKQWRCPLSAFQSTSAVVKRNLIIDNPVLPTQQPILPRQPRLF